ncbi:MAG: cyclophilin-like fold protein [Cyclobacteriaceae bacterium]
MPKIRISTADASFEAEVYDTPTGEAMLAALPIESVANTWGDEIYFQAGFQASLEPGAVAEVQVGELAYWPSMPAFCIFFGPTPVSPGHQPVAASAVNVFGKLTVTDPDILRSVRNGESIKVELIA